MSHSQHIQYLTIKWKIRAYFPLRVKSVSSQCQVHIKFGLRKQHNIKIWVDFFIPLYRDGQFKYDINSLLISKYINLCIPRRNSKTLFFEYQYGGSGFIAIGVIIPPILSILAPVTEERQLIRPINLRTPRKAKINASLKSIRFSLGTTI